MLFTFAPSCRACTVATTRVKWVCVCGERGGGGVKIELTGAITGKTIYQNSIFFSQSLSLVNGCWGRNSLMWDKGALQELPTSHWEELLCAIATKEVSRPRFYSSNGVNSKPKMKASLIFSFHAITAAPDLQQKRRLWTVKTASPLSFECVTSSARRQNARNICTVPESEMQIKNT